MGIDQGIHKIPRGTPTGIIGAEEVWEAGGEVFIIDLEMDGEEKFSTSELEKRILIS